MARLEDKIAEIADASLRQAIAEEVAKLKKRTRFGLVFEEHQPEVVPVHGARIRRGERVALRTGNLAEIWRVLSVRDGQVHCEKDKDATVHETFDETQLIVIRRMGEAIYPAFTPIDAVHSLPSPGGRGVGGEGAPHHLLIEADNYHALQLLLFPYEGKLDCIYIDPPYNTGARDWKYNNDYVDGNDAWRHSKWLTFMAKRLRLAKRLLNPADSVLIVTIDEKEYLNLGMLLRQEFPEARIRMISTVINPKGVGVSEGFKRVDEYVFIVRLGAQSVTPTPGNALGSWPIDDVRDFDKDQADDEAPKMIGLDWQTARRRDLSSVRRTRPGQFYPIYVNVSTGLIEAVGDAIPHEQDRLTAKQREGCVAVFPVREDGTEMNWGVTAPTFVDRWKKGYARAGKAQPGKPQPYIIQYLKSGPISDIEQGKAVVEGHAADGSVIAYYEEAGAKAPPTQWNLRSHNAEHYGTKILRALLPGQRFPFPKSLYAIEDALRLFVANKPNALILDFFAGSGTTAHAVMRLNRQDGGKRQCISVTNNEVSADEQAALAAQGLQPGHPDWERWGICRHITFPRLKAALTGQTPEGEPIKGDYKFTDEFPMAEGFAANLDYFRLDFLEPGAVQMGRQFAAILPLLWMMAGSIGSRPEPPAAHAPWLLPEGCPFAVLMQEARCKDFVRHVEARDDLTHIFVVTNSANTIHTLRKEWPRCRLVQLYKDYLENFRINLPESPAP